jgi:gp16 family phage-associated protein
VDVTPDQFKKRLEKQGKSLAQHSRDVGVPYPLAVAILNGYRKCIRGKGHEAAVKLGLKKAA